ncbi:MAG TPA: sigma-70 family RNA polymerase sigma factor [Acidimicrobiales bacterium]|nr:sigma-70 family RNA polymerase sigma factor [Acidimicrobiales bacterium]
MGTTTQSTITFEDFYRSRAPALHRYATVVAGHSLADDACQDAWLRMWRAWGSADDERLDAWARQVVRNCCIDRRQARGEQANPSVDTPAPGPEPDELVVRRAEAIALGEHVRRLPDHLRDVLWAREMLGLSYAEIAATLEIPIGTVMSRLHSARRKLARKLVG